VSLAQEYAKMIKNACLEYLVYVFICHVLYMCVYVCYGMVCYVMYVMYVMYVCNVM
jgi:hypothetical protein